MSVILNLMLAEAALRSVPQLVDWSSTSAGQLTALGGGGTKATPVQIAETGAMLLGRATEALIPKLLRDRGRGDAPVLAGAIQLRRHDPPDGLGLGRGRATLTYQWAARLHQTLRVTPAIAAGVTDRL
jgi:hypothetical protein